MTTVLETVRKSVRTFMRGIARALNRLSGGRLNPNAVTLAGLFAHIPIAYLIAIGNWLPAALLLLVFGLFDTLDGELARLQNRASSSGMMLDSVTDRMKEVMLYTGTAYFFVYHDLIVYAVVAVAACGGALLVSYTNAWGEVVAAQAKLSGHQINKAFRSGIMGFEVRMFVLLIGLLLARPALAIAVIALFAWITAIQRLLNVMGALKKHA